MRRRGARAQRRPAEMRATMTPSTRVIKVVWQREMLRFWKDRPRLIAGLVQPVLYLFVMGTGISAMVPITSGVPFRNLPLPRRDA